MTAFADPEIHRLTVEQYERIVADHNLDRVELIDGVIYDVSPEMNPHARTVDAVYHLLRRRFPDRLVYQSGSVRLDDGSLWDPDVYVLDAPADHGYLSYPRAQDLLVVVEVAASTWSRDAGLKRGVYARNLVPECWVIDPAEGGLMIRHTNPVGDLDGGPGYMAVATMPLPDGIRDLGATWTAIEAQ